MKITDIIWGIAQHSYEPPPGVIPEKPDDAVDQEKLPDLTGSRVAYLLKDYQPRAVPPGMLIVVAIIIFCFFGLLLSTEIGKHQEVPAAVLIALGVVLALSIAFMIVFNRLGCWYFHNTILPQLIAPPEPLPSWGKVAQALATSDFPDEKNHLYIGQIVGTGKPALIHRMALSHAHIFGGTMSGKTWGPQVGIARQLVAAGDCHIVYFYCNRFFFGAPADHLGTLRRGGNRLVFWCQA